MLGRLSTTHSKLAFSLVELSIVLVILGLLTGGILMGKSLLKSAELQSIISDFGRYETAFNAFRSKYDALPGDMPYATDVWGSAGGTGSDATCYMVTKTTQATCNGDGDGRIFNDAADFYAERFVSWQHLANAGFVTGQYTGRTEGVANTYVPSPGINVPKSSVPKAFFDMVFNPGPTSGHGIFYNGEYNHIALNFYGPSSNGWGGIRPEEAWHIDTKMDDGKPASGKMFAYKRSSPVGGNCTTDDTSTATYDLAATSNNCAMGFSILGKGVY